jgi:hypothetical protein
MELGTVTKDRIQTYIHISAHHPGLTIVKRDYVSVIVMAQELIVNLKYTLIITENIVHVAYAAAIIGGCY